MGTRSAGFLVRVLTDAGFSGGDFLTSALEQSVWEFFRQECHDRELDQIKISVAPSRTRTF